MATRETFSYENVFPQNIPDKTLYSLLAAVQAIPPLAQLHLPDEVRRPVGYFYFVTTACLSVYLGSKRRDIQTVRVEPISERKAFLAPFVSGTFLCTLYYAIKNFNSIEVLFAKGYQVIGVILG